MPFAKCFVHSRNLDRPAGPWNWTLLMVLLLVSSVTMASSPPINVTLPKPNTKETDPEKETPQKPTEGVVNEDVHPLEAKGYVLPSSKNLETETESNALTGQNIDRQFLYTFKNSLSFRGGLALKTDGGNSLTALGLGISPEFWRNDPSDPWQFELNLDWMSNARGHIFGSYKYSFYPRDRFRPFAKASIDLRLEPEDGLVSPLRLDRYGVRIGGGAEYTVRNNLSIRGDLEVYQGAKETWIVAVLGYAWGW